MAHGRHSYVEFYPSDWIAGTARMTPMQELVYFRVCLYNWDKAALCPASELPLMLGQIEGWEGIVKALIAAGKLAGTPDGSVASPRAMDAAVKASAAWEKKSRGGKTGAAKTNSKRDTRDTPDATPAGIPAGSPDRVDGASPPATPSQNQNQNQLRAADDAREEPDPLEIPRSLIRTDLAQAQDAVLDALGCRSDPRWFGDAGRVQAWLGGGAELDLDILPTIKRLMAKRNGDPPRSLKYFDQAIADAVKTRNQPLPEGKAHAASPESRNGFVAYALDRARGTG